MSRCTVSQGAPVSPIGYTISTTTTSIDYRSCIETILYVYNMLRYKQ